jgi:hypothetical protein
MAKRRPDPEPSTPPAIQYGKKYERRGDGENGGENDQKRRSAGKLYLLLRDLGAIIRAITHGLGLVNRRLTASGSHRHGRIAAAALDQDMSLFVQSAFCLGHKKKLPPITTIRIGK